MRRYDVCGLGNALVDIEYHVDSDDLKALDAMWRDSIFRTEDFY